MILHWICFVVFFSFLPLIIMVTMSGVFNPYERDKQKKRLVNQSPGTYVKANGEVDVELLNRHTEMLYGTYDGPKTPNPPVPPPVLTTPHQERSRQMFADSRAAATADGQKRRHKLLAKYPSIAKYPSMGRMIKRIRPSMITNYTTMVLKSVKQPTNQNDNQVAIPSPLSADESPDVSLTQKTSNLVMEPSDNVTTDSSDNVSNNSQENESTVAMGSSVGGTIASTHNEDKEGNKGSFDADEDKSMGTRKDEDDMDEPPVNLADVIEKRRDVHSKHASSTYFRGVRENLLSVACGERADLPPPPPLPKELYGSGSYVLPRSPPMKADKMFGEHDVWRPPLGIDPRVNEDQLVGIESGRCCGCTHDKYLCHEVVFGLFCVHVVLDIFDEKELEMTDDDIEETYQFAYIFALKFLTFDMLRKYDLTESYDIPECMHHGTYKYCFELINWMRNVLYTKDMRCHLATSKKGKDVV